MHRETRNILEDLSINKEIVSSERVLNDERYNRIDDDTDQIDLQSNDADNNVNWMLTSQKHRMLLGNYLANQEVIIREKLNQFKVMLFVETRNLNLQRKKLNQAIQMDHF